MPPAQGGITVGRVRSGARRPLPHPPM